MDLTVIGAGPKGVAVAARAACLRATGHSPPGITIIESHRAGYHWTRGGGWTDGFHRLGTSPLMDLSFPYREESTPLQEELRRYSWPAFLTAVGRYDEWVDRGLPAPRHSLRAGYLKWALECSQTRVIHDTVEALDCTSSGWKICTRSDESLETNAVMVTGFVSVTDRIMPNSVPANTLWEETSGLGAARRVGIIGLGKTAGSALAAIDQLHPDWSVTVVSGSQSVDSRGEGYLENRFYSDPGEAWRMLSEADRRDFIRRTDRAVVSQAVQRQIQVGLKFRHLLGYVNEVEVGEDGSKHMVLADGTVGPFDLVIEGRGGNATWFSSLFTGNCWREFFILLAMIWEDAILLLAARVRSLIEREQFGTPLEGLSSMVFVALGVFVLVEST